MQLGGRDVEDSTLPVAGGAARLLRDESERVGLVQQPQLALGTLALGRVREDAAAEQVAMEISYERATYRELVALRFLPSPFR